MPRFISILALSVVLILGTACANFNPAPKDCAIWGALVVGGVTAVATDSARKGTVGGAGGGTGGYLLCKAFESQRRAGYEEGVRKGQTVPDASMDFTRFMQPGQPTFVPSGEEVPPRSTLSH